MTPQVLVLFVLTTIITFLVLVTAVVLVIYKSVNARRLREREKIYASYAQRIAEILLSDLPPLSAGAKTSAIFKQYESLLAPIKEELGTLRGRGLRVGREALRMALIDFARDITGETSERLVYFFYSMGFVEEQIQMLSDRRWWVRAQSARDLGLLRARRSIAALTAALEDPNHDVRVEAMQSLVILAGVEALGTIFRISRKISVWSAIELSIFVMRYKDAAIPYLIQSLAYEDESVVTFCIEMLAEIGFVEAVEALRKVAADYPNAAIRAKAVEALGRLNDERGEELLVELSHSPFSQVRRNALEALGRIGAPNAIPVLSGIIVSGGFEEKAVAAKALGRCGDRGVSALKQVAANHPGVIADVVAEAMEDLNIPLVA